MAVQRWVTPSDVTQVGAMRRRVVAFAAEQGAGPALLTDLAIAVSEVVANVLLHGEPHDNVSICVDVGDDCVTMGVRGVGVGLDPTVNNAAARMGMVVVAALVDDLRITATEDGGREVAIVLRRAAADPPEARGARADDGDEGTNALPGAR